MKNYDVVSLDAFEQKAKVGGLFVTVFLAGNSYLLYVDSLVLADSRSVTDTQFVVRNEDAEIKTMVPAHCVGTVGKSDAARQSDGVLVGNATVNYGGPYEGPTE